MRIALYLRVSTEDQAKEGYFLGVQREYFEAFVNKKMEKLKNLQIDKNA